MVKKIIIKGKHQVFDKTAAEETALMQNGQDQERFYYICCRGIRSREGQNALAQGDARWIHLQNTVHAEMWHYDILQSLRQQGILPPDEMSETELKEAFQNWLYHNMFRSPTAFASEEEYGKTSQRLMAAGAKPSKAMNETEEISLLLTKDWDRVQKYLRKFHPKAEVLFFQTAPLELLFAYIFLFRPQSVEAERALIFRNDSVLTWELVLHHVLSYEASRIIKKSGNRYIWKLAVMRNYGFVYQFEHKFCSSAKWQQQLERSFDRKYFRKCC